MPVAELNPSSIIAAAGWTGATVSNLSSIDDVFATDGLAGEFISAEADNAPANFASLNNVTLRISARIQGTVIREKQITYELRDSAETVLQTLSTGNLSNTKTTYTAGPFSRSDILSVVNGYRLRATVTEGSGMPDSAWVEIDRMWLEINYESSFSPAWGVRANIGAGYA